MSLIKEEEEEEGSVPWKKQEMVPLMELIKRRMLEIKTRVNQVQVAVYDINGRQVAELVNGYMSAGTYPVTWDANNLSSGIYMLHMISGDFSTMQKVMLIK